MTLAKIDYDTPYYAVIFTSKRTEGNNGYNQMADRMEELGKAQPGFLGIENYHNPDGTGVTISYWRDLEAIHSWKNHTAHQAAQEKGKQQWYADYSVKVCKVEREYSLEG